MSKNSITPTEYEKLSPDEQYYYDPEYTGYKAKKVRSYENCDLGHTHFMGWEEQRTPVGEPVLYRRDNSIARQTIKMINTNLNTNVIDSVNNSNVLMSRVLSKKKWQ